MKFILPVLICLFSSLTQAEKCKPQQLVKIEDITTCAKKGDNSAQYLLGEIYFQGKEAPKNYKASFEWMFMAARQGNKNAQNSLGFNYYNGWGTKKDYVLAYVWWSMSIVNNEEPITRINLDHLEGELSPKELERAQRLAGEWLVPRESQPQASEQSQRK